MLKQLHTAPGKNEKAVPKQRKKIVLKVLSKFGILVQGCTSPQRKDAMATTLCTAVPNNCGPSVWNLLHVTHLAPRILRRRLLDFWKICATLT